MMRMKIEERDTINNRVASDIEESEEGEEEMVRLFLIAGAVNWGAIRSCVFLGFAKD